MFGQFWNRNKYLIGELCKIHLNICGHSRGVKASILLKPNKYGVFLIEMIRIYLRTLMKHTFIWMDEGCLKILWPFQLYFSHVEFMDDRWLEIVPFFNRISIISGQWVGGGVIIKVLEHWNMVYD